MMDVLDPDAAFLDITKRICCSHCATTWTVRITQDKPWIEERHVVVPKIVEEQPKISKSSKRKAGSEQDSQWTQKEWQQWNLEAKIGYWYDKHNYVWYCNACNKRFQTEWACWCHICAKPECQLLDEVRAAVEEYNES